MTGIEAPSNQVLQTEIKALKDAVEAGFEQITKRLDSHAADNKELSIKVHYLEMFNAQHEARDDCGKISILMKDIDDLKQWRWKVAGIATAAGAILGGGGMAILKALAASIGE